MKTKTSNIKTGEVVVNQLEFITRAAVFAAKAHALQKRKYTDEPYIIHPLEVANLVASVTSNPEVIAAALLHDVVEDCGVTFEEIATKFSPRVALLVEQITDTSRSHHGNRAVRKAIDRTHLAGAHPDAQTIKLADLINNTSSIVAFDSNFAKIYMHEKELLLEYLKLGDPSLYKQAAQLVQDYKAKKNT